MHGEEPITLKLDRSKPPVTTPEAIWADWTERDTMLCNVWRSAVSAARGNAGILSGELEVIGYDPWTDTWSEGVRNSTLD